MSFALTNTAGAAPTATTTVVQSSLNPSVVGGPVTFTATVTDNTNNAPVTTGTVDFLDGATPLASAVALKPPGRACSRPARWRRARTRSPPITAASRHLQRQLRPGGTDGQPRWCAAGPTVTTTSPATAITTSSATLSGSVTAIGSTNLTARGIVFAQNSVNPNPTLGGPGVTPLTDVMSTIGAFSENAAGLLPGTNYAFAAYATNSVGTSYGTVVIFTTAVAPPGAAVPQNKSIVPTQVQAPPQITKSFDRTSVLAGGTVKLTFTLLNPNSTALTGMGFVDTLLAGLT